MSMPAEPFHKRCPTCEELKIGFTYRRLINGLCPMHAVEAASGSFVKLEVQGSHAKHFLYGFLRYYRVGNEVQVIRFVGSPNDNQRRFSRAYNPIDVQSITTMSEVDYLQMLVNDGMRAIVQHFGRTYPAHIIQTARTRVLVRFHGGSKSYERWKPVYAVQPNSL